MDRTRLRYTEMSELPNREPKTPLRNKIKLWRRRRTTGKIRRVIAVEGWKLYKESIKLKCKK